MNDTARREPKMYTIPSVRVSRQMYRWLEHEAKVNERTMEGQVRFLLARFQACPPSSGLGLSLNLAGIRVGEPPAKEPKPDGDDPET